MKTRIVPITLHLLCLLCVSIAPQVLAQDRLTEKMPLDPAVKSGKLANGLSYYIRKNGRPEKKVELRLVINAGSILEEDDQQGLAHFTEHMAFNGSKNFKKNDIVSFLQSIGVEFGADLNAYTGFDETVYILPIPTEKKENVEKAFQILEDWASTVAFDNTELDKERGVVLEEDRSGKGADDRMFRVTYPKIFEGSKYSQRLPIGKADIIKTFKPETIKRFYTDWYRPDLMAVVVVGDFDPAEAERLIKKHFEHLKKPTSPKPRPRIEVPARTKSEGLVVTDKEATNHLVEIYYSYKPSKEETTLGDYRQYMVKRLFTSMLSQRMQELTQKAEPPFIFGGSTLGSWARGYEGYNSYAYLAKGGVGPAVQALVQENERARKFGFTANELDRTKKMLMKSMERAFNERDKTESAALVEQYVEHYLKNEPAPGVENEFNYHKEFLESITLDEVNKLAAQRIPPADDNKLVVLTGPAQADFKIPSNDELLALAESAAQTDIKPYEEKAIATSLLEKAPAPGKITNDIENKALGLTQITFANGVRVILKPTDFKNDQVVMSASRFGGQYLYDAKERVNAEYASTIVSQMGVGQFSPMDLRKVLAGKNASVAPRINQFTESVSGQCSANDIETMLQLTYLYFTQPRKDTELFNSFISKQQASYQNAGSDPQYVFTDSLLSYLYARHPWSPKLPNAETFAKIDQQRASEIYKERFSNAHGFTFVIVGKFDVSTLRPLLATYLGSLPSTGKTSTFKDVGLRQTKGPLKKEVRKGTEPKSVIRLFWNGEAPYSEAEQFKIQALTEVINLKIIETLREELGGIYSGGMYGNLNKYPYSHFSIGVNLPCGPENVEKLIQATLGEIEKIRTAGPLEADLNKVKETWKQQYLVNIKDNSFWMRQLLQSVEVGTNAADILEYERKVDALTVKDLQTVANRYLDPKKYIQVVLNPETSN